MPSPCWMPSCWPWASGSRATTARRSAKCCAACCRWHPTSAAAKSIRSPTPAATPPASFLRALERKRFVMVEQVQTERDPLRAPSDRLRVEATVEPAGAGPRGHPAAKLGKPERELLAFLELHPGSHNLKDLESMV